jgi:hypothetical protein
MSKLTTYTVTYRTDAESATDCLAAASPEAALAEARDIATDRERSGGLVFEPYMDLSPIDEITVESPDGEKVAEWISADLLLRFAAPDLLRAVEQAVTALNAAPRFDVPGLHTDSYAIAAECDRAIAKAKSQSKSPASVQGALS